MSDSQQHLEPAPVDLVARLNKRRSSSGAYRGPIRRVLVTGAQGNVARESIKRLLRYYPHVHVHAGVKSIQSLPLGFFNDVLEDDPHYPSRVHFIETPTDSENHATLVKAFSDVDAALIIPSSNTPKETGEAYIRAAHEARPEFLAMIGIIDSAQSNDDCDKLAFAKLYKPLEQQLADTGLAHCILRLPCFLDNLYDYKSDIQHHHKFGTSADGNKGQNYIAVSDIAEVSATILTDPYQKHNMATYVIVGPSLVTFNHIAHLLSAALGVSVDYRHLSEDEAVADLKQKGWDEWKARGMVELWREQNKARSHVTEVSEDFQSIVGHPATPVEQWITETAGRFR